MHQHRRRSGKSSSAAADTEQKSAEGLVDERFQMLPKSIGRLEGFIARLAVVLQHLLLDASFVGMLAKIVGGVESGIAFDTADLASTVVAVAVVQELVMSREVDFISPAPVVVCFDVVLHHPIVGKRLIASWDDTEDGFLLRTAACWSLRSAAMASGVFMNLQSFLGAKSIPTAIALEVTFARLMRVKSAAGLEPLQAATNWTDVVSVDSRNVHIAALTGTERPGANSAVPAIVMFLRVLVLPKAMFGGKRFGANRTLKSLPMAFGVFVGFQAVRRVESPIRTESAFVPHGDGESEEEERERADSMMEEVVVVPGCEPEFRRKRVETVRLCRECR